MKKFLDFIGKINLIVHRAMKVGGVCATNKKVARKTGEIRKGHHMSKKTAGKRGRPVLYKGALAAHVVSLVRKHNARNALFICHAKAGTELAAKRNSKLIPSALNISMPSILKLAKASGIILHRGRPTTKKVVVKAKTKKTRKAAKPAAVAPVAVAVPSPAEQPVA